MMTKGYKILAACAGSMLIAGFFLPWLGKTPFYVNGFSFAMFGYIFLCILPLSGLSVILLALTRENLRPHYMLYPGMACILALIIWVSLLVLKDSGPVQLNFTAPNLEIISMSLNSTLILFHPLKDLSAGFILSFFGICILCLAPVIYRSQYQSADQDSGSYKQVIKAPGLKLEYKRFSTVLLLFAVLIVTYIWCGISPSKLWENRGNAREYLFGRALTDADKAQINAQVERAPQIEAEGLAREYMSNKYRGVAFSQQPSADDKAKEREVIKLKLLSQMDEKTRERLKKETRHDALTQKKGGYFPPETSLPKVKGYIVALIETIAIAIWGTLLALICAIPVSFFAAKNTLELIISSDDLKARSMRTSISFGVRRFLDSCRGFNEFVMALIFVAVIGLGPYAGILALWIHTFGILGKVFSEQIEAIEAGQVEALTSTGAGAAQTIAFSVMPQVMPVFVSYTLLRFESNVRSAAILGFVGAGGIGFLIFDKLNGYLFQEVCTMMIIIIMTVGIIDHFCGKIRMKFI